MHISYEFLRSYTVFPAARAGAGSRLEAPSIARLTSARMGPPSDPKTLASKRSVYATAKTWTRRTHAWRAGTSVLSSWALSSM